MDKHRDFSSMFHMVINSRVACYAKTKGKLMNEKHHGTDLYEDKGRSCLGAWE